MSGWDCGGAGAETRVCASSGRRERRELLGAAKNLLNFRGDRIRVSPTSADRCELRGTSCGRIATRPADTFESVERRKKNDHGCPCCRPRIED